MSLALFCGWAYAIIWGVAFYPTIFLNYKLKTSDSMSWDFIILNLVGYSCYTLSLYLQLYNDTVRLQYKQLFGGRLPLLSLADITYSAHGLLLIYIILSQIIFGNSLWKFNNQRISFRLQRTSRILLMVLFTYVFLSLSADKSGHAFLNFTINLAYCKIIISLVKYLPQVQHNYRRKTMYGISRMQIQLDLLGALFCIAEIYLKNELPLMKAIEANRGKLGITLVASVFSTIFLYQIHIYGTSPEANNKEKSMV